MVQPSAWNLGENDIEFIMSSQILDGDHHKVIRSSYYFLLIVTTIIIFNAFQ